MLGPREDAMHVFVRLLVGCVGSVVVGVCFVEFIVLYRPSLDVLSH